MRRGFYQAMVVILLVVLPLQSAVDILAVPTFLSLHPGKVFFLFLGFLLQPASAIGLWQDKAWGAVLLFLAAVVGVFTSFGASLGPLIMLPLATVRLTIGSSRWRFFVS